MVLAVNNLIGFGGGGSFENGAYSVGFATDTNSPTFAAMKAGSSRADRYLIAAITFYDTDTADNTVTITSLTIGGVSATVVTGGANADGGQSCLALLAIALVPSGAAVDVSVVTSGFSGTYGYSTCTLVREYGLTSATPIASSVGTGSESIDTTGARIVVGAQGDSTANLTGDAVTSNNGGSTLVETTHQVRQIHYLDTTPPGGSVTYNNAGHVVGVHAVASWA